MAKLRTVEARTPSVPRRGSRPATVIMAMTMVLRRMKRGDLTVHGFRSTFRDWTGETTSYAREVAEAALAHVLGDKTEAAYRRGDLFEKRRRLDGEWGTFCGLAPARGPGVIRTQPLYRLDRNRRNQKQIGCPRARQYLCAACHSLRGWSGNGR